MNPMTEIPFESTPDLDAYHQVKIESFKDSVAHTTAWSASRAAWLAAGGGQEGEGYEEMQRLREALEASGKVFTEQLKALVEKVPDELLKKYNRAWKAWYFRDDNGKPSCGYPEPEMSPSGKYKLVITSHATSPGCWSYSKGKVSEVSTGKVIAEVCRNYSAFPYSWVEGHKNGHDYIVCGQDYQGQTIIELDTGKRVDYLPESAYQGIGFCWADHQASPDGTLLGVNGCYWGAPYEGVVYDFSQPLSPPWPELIRSDDDVLGWEGDKCKLGQRRDAVNVPGHPLHGKTENDMTVEELEVIEKLALKQGKKEDDLYAPKETFKLWTPPPALEIAREYIIEILEWAKGNKEPVVTNDYRDQIAAQIARLTEEDRGVLLAEPKVAELLAWMETAPREWKD